MKKILFLLAAILLAISLTGTSNAAPIEYRNWMGEYYETPENWNVIATKTFGPGIDTNYLDHWDAFTWGIRDIDPSYELEELRVVFHGIYNWDVEVDALSVYLFDNYDDSWPNAAIDYVPSPIGWASHWDGQNPVYPNWYNLPGNFVDTWNDPTDDPSKSYDIVYSVTDPVLLSYVQSGVSSFVIAVDPDCHYYPDEITVEVPVPEPATLLLMGSGLIGIAGIGRRKFAK